MSDISKLLQSNNLSNNVLLELQNALSDFQHNMREHHKQYTKAMSKPLPPSNTSFELFNSQDEQPKYRTVKRLKVEAMTISYLSFKDSTSLSYRLTDWLNSTVEDERRISNVLNVDIVSFQLIEIESPYGPERDIKAVLTLSIEKISV